MSLDLPGRIVNHVDELLQARPLVVLQRPGFLIATRHIDVYRHDVGLEVGSVDPGDGSDDTLM